MCHWWLPLVPLTPYKCCLSFLFWVPLLRVRKAPPSGRFQKQWKSLKCGLSSGLRQVTQHDLRLKVPTTSTVVCDFLEVVFYSEASKTKVDSAPDDTAHQHSIKWGWEYNGETTSLQMTQDMSASYQALMCM